MAKNSKQARRPQPAQARSGAPRRLGERQAVAPSAGAQRRNDRRRRQRSGRIGWLAVGGVVVIVAVFLVVRLTGGSSSPASTTGGIASGQTPVLASASIVNPITSVPTSVFDSIGTAGQPFSLVPTKGQPPLRVGSLPRFVYQGAEYCPYCAMERWSMVTALSRFGTFTGLKETSSATDDWNIPTLSFLNSHYTSKYLAFTPYEYLDRNQNALTPVPADVQKLYATYDGSSTGTGTKWSPAGAGIPFLDLDNRFVVSGAPSWFVSIKNALNGGGPGAVAVANAVHDPSSSVGQAISAKDFIVEANYLSAAICEVDGSSPSSVCSSSGVKAAMSGIAKVKPVG